MKNLVHSEYTFTRRVTPELAVGLTLYINYEKKTYDFMQSNEEGVFPRNNNTDTHINRAYFALALEILDFIDGELYGKNTPPK